MKTDLETAVETLKNGGYTCVICKEGKLMTSFERGIKPLIDWYDSGLDLTGAFAADKVVGKAAAMMYVLMSVKQVYSFTMSKTAVETFNRFGVEWSCDRIVDVINNRTNTGSCPMEQAVLLCNDPLSSYKSIKNKLKEFSNI
ncbi:MAG: DUF1893 domain-containing protein [Firmicutes bacterium]|nr:DUF1893 domain-containing protein [Bacillota bacterium]